MRRVARWVGFGFVAFGVVAVAQVHRPLAIGLAVVLAATYFLTRVVLPQRAHANFVSGRMARARVYYRILRLLYWSREQRRAIDISLVACFLAEGKWHEALDRIDGQSQDDLPASLRAAWLNNRAYALARSETASDEALTCIERALTLRPEVPGFQHTYGIALLGCGQVDRAISVLGSMWERSPDKDAVVAELESERCFDLAVAWQHKGENDYALDYFARSYRAAPTSRWGERAYQRLGSDRPAGSATLI